MKEYYTSEEVDNMKNDEEYSIIEVDILEIGDDSEVMETIECVALNCDLNLYRESEDVYEEDVFDAVPIDDYEESGITEGYTISISYDSSRKTPCFARLI